jgi:hypothetical protein
MKASPSCVLCAADVFHCHEVSIRQADGSTGCGDPWCNLPHHLHEWQSDQFDQVDQLDQLERPERPQPVPAGGRRYTETWLSLAS